MASNVGDKFVPLSGGLDLIGSAINKVQGTLIDCQNVEAAPYGGYKPTKMEAPFTGEFVSHLNENFFQVIGVLTGTFPSTPTAVTWTGGTGTIYYGGASVVTAAEIAASRFLFIVVPDDGAATLDGTTLDVLSAAAPGSNFVTVDSTNVTYKFSSLNIRRGRIRSGAHQAYHRTRLQDMTSNYTDGPSVTSGLFTAGTDVFLVGNDTSTATADQIYKATTSGWTLQNPGQEMAFNKLQFEMRYERYTIWDGGNGSTSDADDLDHDGVQANSALDSLDYFPGRIIYWTYNIGDASPQNPTDIVWENQSGSTIDARSTGSSFAATIRIGEYIEVASAADSSNDGVYLVTAATTGTLSLTKQSGTPADDAADATATFEQHADTEYWAEVEHNYIAKGAALEEVASGAVAVASWVPLDLANLRGSQVMDGFQMTNGDRVLVKNQEDTSENGVYVVGAGAPTRATDFDSNEEIAVGSLVNVTNGIRGGGRAYVVITAGDIELDTTGIEFSEAHQAEGAFSLYGVTSYIPHLAAKNAGGQNTHGELSSGKIFLSATTGNFGKWTEANAVNFTGGNDDTATWTPAVGDQLTDGTTQCTVLKIFVDSGAFADDDATGTLVVGRMFGGTTFAASTALDIIGSGSIGSPEHASILTTNAAVNDTDRSEICHNTSTNIEVSLPTRAELVTQSSRYVSSEYNFAASDGSNDPVANKELRLQGTYLCNGAGLALVWDNTNSRLVRMRTGAVVSADRPRHVSIHADRLMLGYGDGTIVLSVVGEPKNFRGIDGAATFGVSSGVTGLSRLNGKASAVFTESTIDVLYGTDTSSFTLDEFSDGSGAIEYTVVDDFGTLYCDRFGITTLQAAEQYGDFNLQRLSRRVGPWLAPRLSEAAKAAGTYPDSAVAIPSKNQYKLLFEDGKILIMAFVQGEDEQIRPEFTYQQIYGVNAQASNPVTATAQNVVNGEDRWYYCSSALVADIDFSVIATRWMDASPMFGPGADLRLGSNQDQDGGFWFIVGPIPLDHPRQNSLIDEFIVSGHHTGWLPIGTAVYEDYEDVVFIDTSTIGGGTGDIWQPKLYNNKELGSLTTGIYKDLRYTEVYVPQAGRGRFAYLVISSAYEDKDSVATAYQTPSDQMTFQNMIVRYGKGRQQQH